MNLQLPSNHNKTSTRTSYNSVLIISTDKQISTMTPSSSPNFSTYFLVFMESPPAPTFTKPHLLLAIDPIIRKLKKYRGVCKIFKTNSLKIVVSKLNIVAVGLTVYCSTSISEMKSLSMRLNRVQKEQSSIDRRTERTENFIMTIVIILDI